MRPRVLIAGLFHETHTFLDETTGLDQFQILRGPAFSACAGDGSPLGGALEAAARLGWDIIPTLDCRAQPSGTAADDVWAFFWNELRPQVVSAVAQGLDAVFLVLHGAMVTTSVRDVEGELLQGLRSIAGLERLPIFGVYDLHANFSPRMAKYADCLVAYRENPHADACSAAVRAFELLDSQRRAGTRPHIVQRHAGILWPPTGTGTGDSPMRDLEAAARRLEHEHAEILAVNITGGFSFSDTPDTGVGCSLVTTGDHDTADRMLTDLCGLAWELRAAGVRRDPSFSQIVDRLSSSARGPIVLAEPSDNIGGGAPGDGTGLLREFVAHRIQNAAVCLCDPRAVSALAKLPLGGRAELPLGGIGSRLDEGPLTLEVELVSRSPGRFTLEDRHSHLASMFGDHFDMGDCAVVRHAGITILLTSVKTPPFDLGQWRCQGIIPERLAVISCKAAVAHRRAYEPIASQMLTVDTPGPCRSDLTTFPYQHLRRPIYPLDGG